MEIINKINHIVLEYIFIPIALLFGLSVINHDIASTNETDIVKVSVDKRFDNIDKFLDALIDHTKTKTGVEQ